MAWLLTVCALWHLCFSLVTGYDCSEVLVASSATIKSPRFPELYPPNCTCKWEFSIDRAVTKITIKIEDFSLQYKEDGVCVDYVEIQGSSTPLGTYCGDTFPSVLDLPPESYLTIIFVSDGQVERRGFLIQYEAVLDEASVSQATAGIVAAVFCAVVFMGIGALRCILKGSATCEDNQQRAECVEPSGGDYEMDCPPTYRTVMEHPERYPTPTLTPQQTPSGTPLSRRTLSHLSHDGSAIICTSDEGDEEPPPPYPGVIVQVENELSRPCLQVREINGSMERSHCDANLEIESSDGGRGTRGQSRPGSGSPAGTEHEEYTRHLSPAVWTVMPRADVDETVEGHTA